MFRHGYFILPRVCTDRFLIQREQRLVVLFDKLNNGFFSSSLGSTPNSCIQITCKN